MLTHIFVMILSVIDVLCQIDGLCNKSEPLEKSSFLNKTILGYLDNQSNNNEVNIEWRVTARKIGICKNIQRCNLIGRDAARLMEQYLKTIKYEKISNAILIDNSKIIRGMDYTINLIVFEGNKVQYQKEFKISSINVKTTTNTTPNDLTNPDHNFELQGSNKTYSDLNYIISADISSCDLGNADIEINWELLDLKQRRIKTFKYKGTFLKVPPKTFFPGNFYYVQCSLLLFNKTQSKKIHKIEVLKREADLIVNIKALRVGKNQPIKLIASYKGDDNIDTLKWKWVCKTKEELCKDFTSSDKEILELQEGFLEIGSYEVTVFIKTNEGVSKNATTAIKVVEIGSRIIEINKIPSYINPSRKFEIIGKIYGLKVGCLAEWQSIEDDDYEYIDLNEIPQEAFTSNNTSDDKLLSNNIDEEGLNNLDYNFILKIPTAKGSWKGLRGGKQYLFRLSSKCSSSTNVGGDIDEIYSEVLIKTAAIPKIKHLTVLPLNGMALITKFKFSTEPINDKDSPFIQSFGYSVNNKTVYFSIISEGLSAETILPYADNGVKTVLKVCNNKMVCIETFGPLIKLNLPENITSETDEYFMNMFRINLIRGDYTRGFSLGIALLETYKYFNNDLQLESVEETVINSVNQVLKIKISEDIIDEDFKLSISELIDNTKTLSKFIKLSTKILNSLIKLQAKFNHELSANIVTKTSNQKVNDMLPVLTEMNDKDVNSLTFYDFQEYLTTSEFIMSQTTNKNIIISIKNSVLEYVKKYLGQLCFLLYTGEAIQIDLITLSLQMDLLNWNYFSNYVYVPNYYSGSKLLIKFDQSWFQEVQSSKLCVAKGLFKKYLQSSDDLFYVQLFDAETRDGFIYNNMQNFVVIKGTKDQTCTVFTGENKWKTCRKLKEANNNLLCSCEDFGFYSVINDDNGDHSIKSTTFSPTTFNLPKETEEATIINNNGGKNKDKGIKPNNNENEKEIVNKGNDKQNGSDRKNVTYTENDQTFGHPANDNANNGNTENSDKNVPVTTESSTHVTRNEILKSTITNEEENNVKATSPSEDNSDVEMLTKIISNNTETSEHIVINNDESTTSNTPIIKTGSFLAASDFKQSDQISLILIGVSVFGMILVGIFGGIMNRIKRERTVEASDGVDFPKYADVFHKETMEYI